MVKGKRTVLALLLALCMIVMLLPATVFAEGENGAAEATNNPSGEEVLAGGTTNQPRPETMGIQCFGLGSCFWQLQVQEQPYSIEEKLIIKF